MLCCGAVVRAGGCVHAWLRPCVAASFVTSWSGIVLAAVRRRRFAKLSAGIHWEQRRRGGACRAVPVGAPRWCTGCAARAGASREDCHGALAQNHLWRPARVWPRRVGDACGAERDGPRRRSANVLGR